MVCVCWAAGRGVWGGVGGGGGSRYFQSLHLDSLVALVGGVMGNMYAIVLFSPVGWGLRVVIKGPFVALLTANGVWSILVPVPTTEMWVLPCQQMMSE